MNGPMTSAEADCRPSPTEPEIACVFHSTCLLQPRPKPHGPLRTLHKSHHFQTSLACEPTGKNIQSMTCWTCPAFQQPMTLTLRHTEDRAPPAVGESYMRLL